MNTLLPTYYLFKLVCDNEMEYWFSRTILRVSLEKEHRHNLGSARGNFTSLDFKLALPSLFDFIKKQYLFF